MIPKTGYLIGLALPCRTSAVRYLPVSQRTIRYRTGNVLYLNVLGKSGSGAAMRSAQGVYHVCSDDNTAMAFVEFVHDKSSAILQAVGGIWAPHVYVPLI